MKVGIAGESGWNLPIDIGGIDAARWLEAFLPLSVSLRVKLNNRSVAIKVLRS